LSRLARAALMYLPVLAPMFFLLAQCSTFDSHDKNAPKAPEKLASEKAGYLPAGLIPTLEVAVHACLVFLEPKEKALHFGPLVSGDLVKKLDFEGKWIRVWIPRLRISGWVSDADVKAAPGEHSQLPPIPEKELTAVSVITERANVREGPSVKSTVMLVAQKDQKFFLIGEREGWFKIWVSELGRAGWIFSQLATRKRPS
jgi:hypothetical protein